MEAFWRPRNYTWEQIQSMGNENGFQYPKISDLIPTLYIGTGLVAAQFVFQRFIFPNIWILNVETGASTNGVASAVKQNSLYSKISESTWKLLCYSTLLLYGSTILWNKSWVWTIEGFWEDYPFQHIDPQLKVYIMAEIGLYISLLITHFSGPKRKDFWMIALHHVVTIALLLFSYGLNAIRGGVAVAVCHDCADVPLELSKICSYKKLERLANFSLIIFVLVWILTRLVLYPFYLLRSVLWCYVRDIMPQPSYTITAALLVLILVLNIIWTYFILKIVVRTYWYRERARDCRSSDEDDDSNEAEHRKGD